MGIPATLSSVPAATPYIQYIATNGQTVFPYPFPITQDSDLMVVVNGVTLQTDAGYTLSGQGNATGGNVTFTLGQAANAIITIFRDITIERVTQFAQNSGFSSAAFNAEYNNIYLILQQLQDSIGFALQVPNTNNPLPVTVLTPGAYAGKYLSFDTNGNPTPAVLTSSGALTAGIIGGLIYPKTTPETNAGVTPVLLQYPVGNVLRYGAVGDGTTNDQQAIKAAFNVMIQQGGGTVTFPYGVSGVYNVVGTDASPSIPTLQSDFSILAVATPCQLYISGLANTRVVFEGSTIHFATTNGGYGIAFDGFTNVRMVKPKFSGMTTMVNGTPGNAGVSAVALLSITNPSTQFATEDFTSNACFAGIVATGDPTAAQRVTGISMEGRSSVSNCEYGYAFQNNGDQVFVEDGYTFALNRPVFIYGAEDMTLNIVSDTQQVVQTGAGIGGGLNLMIKAYSRRTRNISLNVVYKNNYSWSARLGFESQYNPANQVAPAMVENVYTTIDEVDNLPFASAPGSGATSATLALSPGGSSQTWQGPSGTANVKFSDNEVRICTFTNGSASISWSGGLTNAVKNIATGGTGFSTYFSLFAGTGGTVLQSSSSLPVYNNIVLRGFLAGVLATNVDLSTAAAQCAINIDGLVYTPPANIAEASTDVFNNNGFVSSRKFTYLPVLSFNSGVVGITYAVQAADYYIEGGICTVIGSITLSAKGSSSGAATVSMPFPTRADSSRSPMFTWLGNTGMSSMGSPVGFISSGSAVANLLFQGTTSTTSAADTNFGNSSQITFQASFPI